MGCSLRSKLRIWGMYDDYDEREDNVASLPSVSYVQLRRGTLLLQKMNSTSLVHVRMNTSSLVITFHYLL